MPLKALCDENIPRAVIASLNEWGFNVKRVTPSAEDPDIAMQAKREERIIITFDSDFSNILEYPPAEYFGIIRIKIDPPFITLIVPALKRVFDRIKTPEEFRGTLVIAEAETFRVWKKEEPP